MPVRLRLKVCPLSYCLMYVYADANSVLPPISTAGMTTADVDHLTKSTQESMLKTLLGMSEKEEEKAQASHVNGASTAVEI